MSDVPEVAEDSSSQPERQDAAADPLVPDLDPTHYAAASSLSGVDLSHWNVVDISRMKADFFVLKVGGSDAGRYTDSLYAQRAADVRKAGKHLGHYWFNGSGDPVADARYYVAHLSHYQDEDLLVLDVEHEAAGTPWSPSQALTFFKEVKRLKPKGRLFAYMSSSLTRESNWRNVVDFGVKLWVASYGSNTGSKPAGSPLIEYWSDWSIWQYTDIGHPSGASGDIDLDFAKGNLFTVAKPAPAKPAPAPAPKPTPAPTPKPEEHHYAMIYGKENSSPKIYAIDLIAATKRWIQLPEWEQAKSLGFSVTEVPSLSAYKTV